MINFPTSLDTLTNPASNNTLDSPSHSGQHSDVNDAIEAIEAKVGADGSAVNTTHDFKLSGVSDGDYAASIDGTETLTNKTLTSPTLQGDVSGWIVSTDTWVYASASTFTIAGVDRTTTYTKGTRLKWNEGTTVKYGVVVGSAFSTNTTVTIAVNTDYVITETTLSAAAYSYAANPQGYPTWFNYTPSLTWTAGAAPSGTPATTTIAGRYNIIGSSCTLIAGKRGYTAGTNVTRLEVTTPVLTLPNSICIGMGYIGTDPAAAAMFSPLIFYANNAVSVVCAAVAATAWYINITFPF